MSQLNWEIPGKLNINHFSQHHNHNYLKQMKILFFIESLRSGGRERRLCELIKGLHQAGSYKMELILTEKDIHYKDIFETEIKLHFVPRLFLKKDPTVFYRIFAIARRFKPDIIHTWSTMTTFYALPTKALLNTPLIDSEISNTKPMYLPLFRKINFKFADKITSNTIAGLKAYEAPTHKSSAIYNGFDFRRIAELASPSTVRQRFNITTPHVIAMVGTFYPQKDYLTYIKAANELVKKREDITFLCIGAGDYSALEAISTNKKKIRFLGKQNDIESIMNICDIGILTTNSYIHGEGISNALLEFCSLGVPVIATDFGGSPELIKNSINGYLIPPFNFKQLAAKIQIILSEKKEQKRMGLAAKQIVENQFGLESMVQKFIELYNTTLKE